MRNDAKERMGGTKISPYGVYATPDIDQMMNDAHYARLILW